jgi:glycosyltransferase involved in cell wall biosynthesis
MSGVCVNSARAARQKFGARVILERGSRHILSQKEILEAIPEIEKPAVPEFNVRRELWGYEFADVMSIPSRHVEQSFVDRGYPREKLFRNPYGVDLTMFPPTPKPQNQIPTIVFAGEWSLRKGCDLLMKALEGQSWRVIHVGARGDAPAPKTANFESRGFVQQSRLAEIYGIADVAVLPSREDGFGLVLAQALACGLPLACTDRTGGEDLSESVDSSWITVVQANNVTALRAGIRQALGKAATQCGVRDIVGSCGERLSWRAYGRRYSDALEKIKAREFSL